MVKQKKYLWVVMKIPNLQKFNIDTKNGHNKKRSHLFQVHHFGALQPLVFGGVVLKIPMEVLKFSC